jgi:UDP-N-acetyl-D-glucosamine dehydrogenase
VAVIGLGYVGLPLAIAFIEAGLDVEGIDALDARVAELNAGSSPIDDISNDRLEAALAAGLRVVTPADATIADADAIFVCVPTPITTTKDPDLAPVLSAAATIRDHVRAGQLVILQSTTFPGTTTGPFREAVEASGLKAGIDFDLAFAPERVNPGDPASASKGVPRLVGATTPEATKRAAALLRRINDQVVELSSPDAAELAKLLENVFRNVNIAFVNQLALLCERMGLDVWEVINAAATKPFGFMKFTPGPGVGGHCIPVDPYYLAWRAREFDFIDRFIELAGDINFAMPRHVVDLVGEALNDRGRALKGAKVGVLGVAFKPNVRDARNSPAADVLAGLASRGADVRFHDPHVETFRCLVCGRPVDPSRSFVCPQYRPDTAGACRLCYQLAAAHTYAARALETCPDEGGPATHITWDQEGRRLVDGELGAEHLTTGRVCPCALAVPLDGHDRDPAQWAVVEQVVADLGELFLITVGDRHFRVSRYCVALHGVRAETIGYYGFEEIGG